MNKIQDLDLTVRTHEVLKRAGRDSIGDIDVMSDTELLAVKNLDEKSLQDIREQINKYRTGKHYECKYCDCTRGIPYPDEPDFLVCARCGAEWLDCRILVADEEYET